MFLLFRILFFLITLVEMGFYLSFARNIEMLYQTQHIIKDIAVFNININVLIKLTFQHHLSLLTQTNMSVLVDYHHLCAHLKLSPFERSFLTLSPITVFFYLLFGGLLLPERSYFSL